ncbi:MAG: SRPBCC domain-containing protein [Gammaproteobacteria bacterium]|nr:SRPBCC domain-containing protein [Gammaproteobacteria bacterium]
MPARGYAHRIDVRAPRELVWRALIEPDLLVQWYGLEARIAARSNGSYRIRIDADLVREAHIDVFEPGRRLRLIYMPQPLMPPTDSVIVDDFILDVDAGQTTLRLLGSGYPDAEGWESYYLRLRQGWPRALARLKVAMEKIAGGTAS